MPCMDACKLKHFQNNHLCVQVLRLDTANIDQHNYDAVKEYNITWQSKMRATIYII